MAMLILFVCSTAITFVCVLFSSRRGEQDTAMASRFAKFTSSGATGLQATGELDLLKRVAPQVSGVLATLLMRSQLGAKLNSLLAQANSSTGQARFVRSSMMLALGAGVVARWALPNTPLAFLAAGLAGGLPLLKLRFQARQRIAAFEKALPEVIDTMTRSLRAGHSLVAAIGIVAEGAPEPARSEFTEVFRQQNFGLPLREALMQMLKHVPSQDLRVVVTGILVQKESGGNLTQILDRTSATIRERLKLKGEIRVHTAQGRMTGWILCILPVALLLIVNALNPGYSRPMFENPTGRELLYVGAGLIALGAFLINRIVNSIEI